MTGFVGFFRVQYKRKIVDNKIRGKILVGLFLVGLLWGDHLDKSLLASLPLDGIEECLPVSGGDVNRAFKLVTKNQNYFLLVQPVCVREFYAAEIAGLNDLKRAKIIAPEVISTGKLGRGAYLLLSYLEKGEGSQADLGRTVAKMHRTYNPSGQFGYKYDYVGSSISFSNDWRASWAELFVNNRLDILAQKLVEDTYWKIEDFSTYMQVRQLILTALSQHDSKPSLLHGDLWAGNFLFTEDGQPALIDPAPLYGDREFDLGITTVFGGFTEEFYQAYQESYSLKAGYSKRMHFYRLYYLMVHLDKFGRSYKQAVADEMQAILQAG